MKKSTLMRLAMTLTLALFVSGVFAQINITVRLHDGTTPAAGTATLYTINAVGVETATAATNNALGVISYACAGNTLYSIHHTSLQRTTFRTIAVPVSFTTYLNVANIATNYTQATTTTYQTTGKKFRLYAAPDPVYSPSYDGTAATISANSRWTWTYATLVGVPATTVVSPAQTNWVEFDGTTAAGGPYSVSVSESNTIGCAATSSVTQNVVITPTPDATINGTTAAGTWTASADAVSLTKTACVSTITGTETVTVSITEGNVLPIEFRSYGLAIKEVVDNVKADLTTTDGAVSNQTWDYPLTNKLKTGNATIPGTHTWTPVLGTSTYVFPTSALAISNNKPTRYTYFISQASDAGATAGIVSGISQKSDYETGGAASVYGLADIITIRYIVLPAPTTGPIYHISNTYSY